MSKLTEMLDRWRARRREAKALKRYGWDGQCRACEKWHHADDAGKLEAETEMHWHYRCECGHLNSYALWAPFPVADDEAGRTALATENAQNQGDRT